MNQDMIEKLKDVSPMSYVINVDLGGTPGDVSDGTEVINRSDFALMAVKWAVVGDDGTDDQQFSLDWSEQNTRRYWKGANAPMALTFGNPRTSIWSEFRKPIVLKENTTIYIRISNHYAAPGATRKIQIIFEGFEKRRM